MGEFLQWPPGPPGQPMPFDPQFQLAAASELAQAQTDPVVHMGLLLGLSIFPVYMLRTPEYTVRWYAAPLNFLLYARALAAFMAQRALLSALLAGAEVPVFVLDELATHSAHPYFCAQAEAWAWVDTLDRAPARELVWAFLAQAIPWLRADPTAQAALAERPLDLLVLTRTAAYLLNKNRTLRRILAGELQTTDDIELFEYLD